MRQADRCASLLSLKALQAHVRRGRRSAAHNWICQEIAILATLLWPITNAIRILRFAVHLLDLWVKVRKLGGALDKGFHGFDEAAAPRLEGPLSSLCIDGTSSTALLVDSRRGDILAPTKIYNEDQGAEAFEATEAIAAEWHCARRSTSTLAQLINWHNSGTWQQAKEDGFTSAAPCRLACCYPDWLLAQPYAGLLPPRVLEPGKAVGTITDQMAQLTGLPKACTVCAGTSDSTSAFIAAGVQGPGEAVTSLGSTFAPKLLSKTRVDNAFYGVYSQRIGDSWLVGGASSTGGAVLKEFFTSEQLKELSAQIDPDQPSGLDYYPLTKPGERFPVNDPHLEPRLTPRPESDVQFLHDMLEGMANIEARAYGLLRELGAAPLTKVYTAGGGSKNPAWLKIRERKLGMGISCASIFRIGTLLLRGIKAPAQIALLPPMPRADRCARPLRLGCAATRPTVLERIASRSSATVPFNRRRHLHLHVRSCHYLRSAATRWICQFNATIATKHSRSALPGSNATRLFRFAAHLLDLWVAVGQTA
ncbi:hypothetical protein WJX82_008547 [Trebouxia sp. C0006]